MKTVRSGVEKPTFTRLLRASGHRCPIFSLSVRFRTPKWAISGEVNFGRRPPYENSARYPAVSDISRLLSRLCGFNNLAEA